MIHHYSPDELFHTNLVLRIASMHELLPCMCAILFLILYIAIIVSRFSPFQEGLPPKQSFKKCKRRCDSSFTLLNSCTQQKKKVC